MKLTKDMFDFEKYDYRFGYPCAGDQYLLGDRWVDFHPLAQRNATAVLRTPKPLPRYILLNEWDPLKPGDELLEQGHTSLEWGPPADHIVSGNVEPGEIWRRKVQE